MRNRNMTKIAALMLAAALAVSCIYPFSIDSDEVERILVLDGSIFIGEVCTFNVSYVQPLSGASIAYGELASVPPGGLAQSKSAANGQSSCNVTVEADDGKSYKCEIGLNGYYVDLSEAPSDVRYRICVELPDEGRTYHSEWQDVVPQMVIDDLSYHIDKESESFAILLSAHSNGSEHFNLTYQEHWQELVLVSINKEGEKEYGYRWFQRSSPGIQLYDTSNQTEDRIIGLEFITMPLYTSAKLKKEYIVDVTLEPMTDDAYAYWNAVKRNSDKQGSIFAPIPSAVKGNVSCDQDPDELVIGYVRTARRTEAEVHYP